MKSTLACLRNPHSHIAAANSSDSGGPKFLLKALALAITNLQYYTPKETFRAWTWGTQKGTRKLHPFPFFLYKFQKWKSTRLVLNWTTMIFHSWRHSREHALSFEMLNIPESLLLKPVPTHFIHQQSGTETIGNQPWRCSSSVCWNHYLPSFSWKLHEMPILRLLHWQCFSSFLIAPRYVMAPLGHSRKSAKNGTGPTSRVNEIAVMWPTSWDTMAISLWASLTVRHCTS